MGDSNTQPQAPIQPMQGQGFSNTAPMTMPRQSQFADDQTEQMISNYQRMQQSGIFDTPYQKAMKAHPFLMGLANGMQSFGQGVTKQPFYTSNQDNQAQLQNTQLQGMNQINAMPAQLRMMMAMQGMYNQPGSNAMPTATPGITPVISTPTQNPMAMQMAAAKSAGYSDAEIQAYLAGKK